MKITKGYKVTNPDMKQELTVQQMEDAMLYLLQFHQRAKDMLHGFWQRTSDACPLEASEQDYEILEWNKWVHKHLY